MKFYRQIGAEIWASARSQWVSSLIVAAVACLALATAGVVLTQQQRAIVDATGAADDVELRLLTVDVAAQGVTLDPQLVANVAQFPQVTATVGMGRAVDIRAAALPTGTPVAARDFVGTGDGVPPCPAADALQSSTLAAATLGLPPGAGSVEYPGGRDQLIAGTFETPNYLRGYEPIVVNRASCGSSVALSTLIVVTRQPEDVAAVRALIGTFLVDYERDDIQISSPIEVLEYRAELLTVLRERAQQTVLGSVAAVAASVVAVIGGQTVLRRSGYGRRRALGASRSMIVAFVLGETAISVLAGLLVGQGFLIVFRLAVGQPPIQLEDVAAGALIFAVATIAALIPATFACTRDPVRELRQG